MMKDTSNNCGFFENRDCQYYPCHNLDEINCLFCYCPLYSLEDCPGEYRWVDKGDKKIKTCIDCTFPHIRENYCEVIKNLKEKML